MGIITSAAFKGIISQQTFFAMFRLVKAAGNLSGQAVRQVRHSSTAPPNFHTKYGNGLLVGGLTFCVGVWSYVLTQTGITWNLSPVGKVMPKPWREPEAEEE